MTCLATTAIGVQAARDTGGSDACPTPAPRAVTDPRFTTSSDRTFLPLPCDVSRPYADTLALLTRETTEDRHTRRSYSSPKERNDVIVRLSCTSQAGGATPSAIFECLPSQIFDSKRPIPQPHPPPRPFLHLNHDPNISTARTLHPTSHPTRHHVCATDQHDRTSRAPHSNHLCSLLTPPQDAKEMEATSGKTITPEGMRLVAA